MGDERSRRRVLELAGVGAGLSLAGCAAGPGTGQSPDDPPESGTGTGTDRETATETPTTTDTPEPSMSTVFHFASEPDEQSHAVANVSNLLDDDSTDVETVVLVANGRGIELLPTEESRVPGAVRELVGEGVSFRADVPRVLPLDGAVRKLPFPATAYRTSR